MVQLFRSRFFAVSAVVLLALVVLSNLSRAGGQPPPQGSLILDPQLINIMQGYGFNVNVTVQDVTNLGWFGTYLDFNTSRISMQTYAFRDGWSGGCGASSPPHEGLYCSGSPPSGFTGSAVVLTITFRCEGAGSSQITPSSSQWTTEEGGYRDFAVTQGATVNQAAPVTVTSTVTDTTTIALSTTTTTSVSTTTEISTTTLLQYVTTTFTTTVTVHAGAAVGGIIGPMNKTAVPGVYVDLLGLIVAVAVVVGVIMVPAARRGRKN